MATLSYTKVAVLGATGPTGYHVVESLRECGLPLRAVSRSREHLDAVFPDETIEKMEADLVDAPSTLAALTGCDLVFLCVGLPAQKMHQHPVIARNVAAATREVYARCVDVSSFWAYLPLQYVPLTEAHPRTDGAAAIRWRREAEDVLLTSGAAVLNLPDFYGPRVHMSTLQQALHEARAGKAMNWIGAATTGREYVYVPDAMAMAAKLAFEEGAFGERWVIPGAGPVSANDVAEMAGRILEKDVRVRAASPGILRFISLFNRQLRGFMPLVPEYTKAITYDASKLQGLIGKPHITSYEDGFRATFQWMDAGGGR